MKRTIGISLCLAVLCCFFYALPGSAAVGEAKFGTGITKDWKLENEGREFDTNLISCAFYCEEAINSMQAAVSIYFTEDGNKEALLARVVLDVNPEWGILVLPEIPLPSTGLFTFTLSKTTGETLATGQVKINEKKVDEAIPEQPKVDGTTVEALFNKFKPQ